MYGEILKTPGVARVYLASIVGRLPLGALGLLLILRTREMTGSYAAGGAVAAAFAVASGVGAPMLGRIVDRRGQAAVLVPAGLVSGALLGVFAALPGGTPTWLAAALAALTGVATPPLSSCQRALWTDVLAPRLRHSAYALDSVVFELVYITGPLLLVGAVGAWSLQAALGVAAAAGAGGAMAFAFTHLSRNWRPHTHRAADRWGPLRGAGVRTLLMAIAFFGVGIAAAEVALAAFADREGSANTVGLLLAAWGIGSMCGGLVAGRRPPPRDPASRLAVLLLALALLEVPLVVADDLWTMGVAITVAGVAIAPALSLAFQLLSEVAPRGTITEAQTWAASAIGVGIALGSGVGGWVVEHAGITEALWLVVAAGLIAALVVAGRRRTLAVPEPAAAAATLRPQPEAARA
jgi:predicted MFS family arabinose efflux permease